MYSCLVNFRHIIKEEQSTKDSECIRFEWSNPIFESGNKDDYRIDKFSLQINKEEQEIELDKYFIIKKLPRGKDYEAVLKLSYEDIDLEDTKRHKETQNFKTSNI